MPSRACWVAAATGSGRNSGGVPTRTIRAQASSRRRDGASTARKDSRSSTARAALTSITTAPSRAPEAPPEEEPPEVETPEEKPPMPGCDGSAAAVTTGAPADVRIRTIPGSSGASPTPRTSAGPTSRGCPTAYRRRLTGRGRPSMEARLLPGPLLTRAPYRSPISDRLKDRHDTLAAGRTDGDQAAARSLLGQLLGQ